MYKRKLSIFKRIDKMKRSAAIAPPGLETPTATEQVQVVDTSEQSNLDVLLDSILFVSEGKMISTQTLKEVDRMLHQLQERFDLVQLTYDHYMTKRLGVYLKRVQTVEDHIFNSPDVTLQERLDSMEPEASVNLLKMLYSRLDKASGYVTSKGSIASGKGGLNTSNEAVKGVVESKVKQEDEEVTSTGQTLPPEARENLRNILECLVKAATINTVPEKRVLELE
jgi:hypothetical protein